jgi:fumarate reductase flavoprotein subunit
LLKQLETDVVVIAAGTAGLAATVAAAENGANVIVFEKAATVGGAGNMARGPFAVESKLQSFKKIGLTREQVFKMHMEYTHWRVDGRLVSEYINKSADTIDWLEKMGVNFLDVQCHNYGYNFTWHIIGGPMVGQRSIPGTGINMMKVLVDTAKKLGVKFFMRTPAKKIIKEAGRVTSVIAESDTGEEIRAKAKAVIIATGGFGDNPEMIKKYTGWEMEHGMVPGVNGDGIRMAWEVGAARTEIIMHGMAGSFAGQEEKTVTISWVTRQPNLVVNLLAERFMNEEITQTSPFGGNAIGMQKDRTAFVIFDEDTKQQYLTKGLDFPPGILVDNFNVQDFDRELKQALDEKNPNIIIADSINEVATKTGLNEARFTQTIEEYNKACETGRDGIFYKSPRYLRPVKRPKFYVFKLNQNFAFGSLGGIKINYKTEVMNNNFDIIPGLYAAGLDANSIYGDTYLFYLPGNTLGFALNSGRIAGENAAAYVKNC